MYGNEREVGSAIRDYLTKDPSAKRQDIFYTTKLASNNGYNQSLKSLQTSLQRCGLDYIDLILIHSPYDGPHARKESWEALLEAQKRGWTKSIGVSNYGVKHLQEMLKQGNKPVVNQVDLHPFMTRTDIVDFSQENDIVLEVISLLTEIEIGIRSSDKRIPDQASSFIGNCEKVRKNCGAGVDSMGLATRIR